MATVERVYVHIGPPKTATTFIQSVLRRNGEQLDAERCVLPRRHRQHGAVLRLLARTGSTGGAGEAGIRGSEPHGWDGLVDEVRGADADTAIVSVEGLSRAGPVQVGLLVESFAPAEVHVVYGARDLAQLVPAFWQSRLRNGAAPSWRDLLESVRNPAGEHSYGDRFWSQFDPRRALAAWLAHVPAHRVHVITVPPAGSAPGLVWKRFCAVVGLDADRYDLDVPRANVSLGGVEAEVLRRVTGRVSEPLTAAAYADVVKQFVAREVLERRQQSFRLTLPAAELAWLAPRAEAATGYLRDTGFPVAGDLDDLLPLVDPGARDPDDVTDAEVLALMDEVLAETVLEMARRGGVTLAG